MNTNNANNTYIKLKGPLIELIFKPKIFHDFSEKLKLPGQLPKISYNCTSLLNSAKGI